jgi:hypothetical protein
VVDSEAAFGRAAFRLDSADLPEKYSAAASASASAVVADYVVAARLASEAPAWVGYLIRISSVAAGEDSFSCPCRPDGQKQAPA